MTSAGSEYQFQMHHELCILGVHSVFVLSVCVSVCLIFFWKTSDVFHVVKKKMKKKKKKKKKKKNKLKNMNKNINKNKNKNKNKKNKKKNNNN